MDQTVPDQAASTPDLSAAGPPTAQLDPVEVPDVPRVIRTRTGDETASLVGAAVASFALVWIAFFQVLPWSGAVGFVICWWFTFLVMYAVVSSLANPRVAVVERLVSFVVQSAAALVGVALASTVLFIFVKGWPAVHHLNFYTQDMAGVRPTDPLTTGGVSHAIAGTLIEVAIAIAISLPLGVATAVYMIEVRGRLAHVVRTVVEAMTALPDILAGLFIYTVLIIGLQWERTGLTVALALSVTMIPIIARATDVTLRVVPGGLREASMALGASQWQTVRRVVLPTARTGIVTALILGIARIAGESAPLLIVSAASSFLNADPTQGPMNSLPLFIFLAIVSGQESYTVRGYGAAALLLAIVMLLFGIARLVGRNRVRA